MFGVSPKFFVVRSGEDYRVDDYVRMLDRVSSLGFESFQGEIFKESQIVDWEENAYRIEKRAGELGLIEDMFVAHFLMEGSVTSKAIKDERYDALYLRVLDIISVFKTLKTICVPIGKYIDDGENDREEDKRNLTKRLVFYSEKAEERGLNFAVEVIFGALMGYEELAGIKEKYKLSSFGLNLDTGNANLIMHDDIYKVPSILQVYGTHIKDNDGKNADEKKPGDGTIDWPKLIRALEENGYTGSYDYELSSPDDGEYIKASDFLKEIINKNKTGGNL